MNRSKTESLAEFLARGGEIEKIKTGDCITKYGIKTINRPWVDWKLKGKNNAKRNTVSGKHTNKVPVKKEHAKSDRAWTEQESNILEAIHDLGAAGPDFT